MEEFDPAPLDRLNDPKSKADGLFDDSQGRLCQFHEAWSIFDDQDRTSTQTSTSHLYPSLVE